MLERSLLLPSRREAVAVVVVEEKNGERVR